MNRLNRSKNLSNKTELYLSVANLTLTLAESYLRFQFYSLNEGLIYPNVNNANGFLVMNCCGSLFNKISGFFSRSQNKISYHSRLNSTLFFFIENPEG